MSYEPNAPQQRQPRPYTPEQLARQDGLRRATRPEMFTAVTCRRFGPGYPKRLHREVQRAYRSTHLLLADMEYARHTPERLLRAADNYRRAQRLLISARRLPRTFIAARVRAAALDNESVAYEILEVLAHALNRLEKNA